MHGIWKTQYIQSNIIIKVPKQTSFKYLLDFLMPAKYLNASQITGIPQSYFRLNSRPQQLSEY